VNLNAEQAKLFQLSPQPLTITNASTLAGSLILGGNGGIAARHYVVLVSTNLTAPQPGWTALSTNTFDFNGAFQITNSINPGAQQLFYRLKSQ
jgi:hypothetical protein